MKTTTAFTLLALALSCLPTTYASNHILNLRQNGIGSGAIESTADGLLTERTKFSPTIPFYSARFGISVDISDDKAIVGAFEDDTGGDSAGAAYIYDLQGQQLHLLLSSSESDHRFALSTAIDGGIALVGAPGDSIGGSNAGAAFIFDAEDGNELHRLGHPGLSSGDNLGWSVALEGNLAVVSAPFEDIGANNSGVVYVFDADDGTLLHTLVPEDPSRFQFFGSSVAISGDHVLVGAERSETSQNEYGAAYLFDLGTGEQKFKFRASDPSAKSQFGASVDIHGDLAVVGAPDQAGDGAVYVFDVNSGIQLGEIFGEENDLGNAVALNDDFLVVGDWSGNTSGASSGSAYVYDAETLELITKLIGSDIGVGHGFGSAVAINQNGIAMVGAWQAEGGDNATRSGAAYGSSHKKCPIGIDVKSVETISLVHERRIAFHVGISSTGDRSGDRGDDHCRCCSGVWCRQKNGVTMGGQVS